MNPMKALRAYQKVNSHAQISEASPHRLIQMLYEGGLDRLAQAKGALARGDIPQKCLMLTKAIDIITGLRHAIKAAFHQHLHQTVRAGFGDLRVRIDFLVRTQGFHRIHVATSVQATGE